MNAVTESETAHAGYPSRRDFLATGAAALGSFALASQTECAAQPPDGAAQQPAQIAITLDLEMSRNFPKREDTHWDYEKGNLDEDTKQYALEAARRVARRGAKIHFFAVGRVFEQENVDWLAEIVRLGHPVGNHTYDHVYLLASRPDELQYRFRRAPWLIEGKSVEEVIRENIRLTDAAMLERLGTKPAGFRTPGGFSDGLDGRTDLQQMLLDLGFDWVSSKYPRHATTDRDETPDEDVYRGIIAAQHLAQPFVYPTGLVEVPMSPISDIGAFRGGRWPLKYFLEAIRRGVTWAIDNRTVFDFLGHPSCLLATDPKFQTIDLICDLTEAAGDRAEIVDLGTIAERTRGKVNR